MFKLTRVCATGAAVSLLAASALQVSNTYSADHQEAPAATALLAADIGDFYIWHEDSQLNLVLTFGTFSPSGQPASYDSNLLYTFHFDTSEPADGVADNSIYARFAEDAEGNWGLQVTGASVDPIEGAVETVLSDGDVTAWAGLADDPFFFDQTGFRETLDTGMISFNPSRDDVAGLNITAIVVQLPVETIKPGGGALQAWVTTGTL
ncbi:MAG: DUF4331 domain-containing protein [Gammaproteobacteria bacterium]|nr:DUF4331 domain-containing protein [Gammaproteobacteria bacterium]